MTVLSDACVLALQAATAAACVEALNAAPPSELCNHVLAIVNPVITAHARKHRKRTRSVDRLPDELLVGIFEFLPFWDRVRAATVCQRWRTASLDAVSALWSDIPHLANVRTYEPLLARARGRPVALTYVPDNLELLGSFCYTISRSLGRIKGLRLILQGPDDDDESPDAARYLNGVLSGTAPILESLVISDPAEMFSQEYSSLPILNSPILRTIELDGFDLSLLDACVDSPTLNILRVTTPVTYNRLSPKDWSHLTRLGALEVLQLCLGHVFFPDIPVNSPRLPQSLQQLYLRARPAIIDALVSIENLSRFQIVHIFFLEWHADVPIRPLAALMPSLGDTTVSGAVHFGAAHFSLLASDGAGRQRVFQRVRLHDGWHTLLRNVTRLWLDADLNAESSTTKAVFPALEELTLDATIPNIPLGRRARTLTWSSLSCPCLRTVRFISENPRPALPAGQVLDYLTHTLDFPARLENLIFDGVSLSSEPGVNLTAVANTVAMVQSGEIPAESYRAWANPWDSEWLF